MNILWEPALLERMEKTGKRILAVEVAQSNGSDFEVTELHLHLVSEKQAAFLQQKKRFRAVDTAQGTVLLPPYRLEYDDTVVFGLKSFWLFKLITQKGIHF